MKQTGHANACPVPLLQILPAVPPHEHFQQPVEGPEEQQAKEKIPSAMDQIKSKARQPVADGGRRAAGNKAGKKQRRFDRTKKQEKEQIMAAEKHYLASAFAKPLL